VALFKNTAIEWMQDKCPQLGAALANFTVFSLAPLVLVLLTVFGLIFGGSDQHYCDHDRSRSNIVWRERSFRLVAGRLEQFAYHYYAAQILLFGAETVARETQICRYDRPGSMERTVGK
jgi:uncharacterized BrkB/YihY/UPF0761 family membrane protein